MNEEILAHSQSNDVSLAVKSKMKINVQKRVIGQRAEKLRKERDEIQRKICTSENKKLSFEEAYQRDTANWEIEDSQYELKDCDLELLKIQYFFQYHATNPTMYYSCIRKILKQQVSLSDARNIFYLKNQIMIESSKNSYPNFTPEEKSESNEILKNLKKQYEQLTYEMEYRNASAQIDDLPIDLLELSVILSKSVFDILLQFQNWKNMPDKRIKEG